MATQAQFAATPHHEAHALSSSVETSLTTPTHATLIFTPGANGSKIEEIIVEVQFTSLAPVTVAALVYLFIYNGTSYFFLDTITVSAVTGSTTTAPFRSAPYRVPNLWLSGSGAVSPLVEEYLYASISVAPTSGTLLTHVFAGDY